MGVINVEGLGAIEIKGDQPTQEELQVISEQVRDLPKSDSFAAQETDNFLSSPSFGRIVLEVGLGVAGSLLTGGAALPALAARASMLSRPFLMQLAKSSLGSGVGSGTGAGISQTFDPTDNAVQDIVRATTTGILAEGVGGPITIKAFQGISKALGKSGIAGRTKMYAGSDEVEKILSDQAQKNKGFVKVIPGGRKAEQTLLDKADDIISNPSRYSPALVEEATKLRQPVITLGLKGDSRTFDIMENIAENSIFGGKAVKATKERAKQIGEAAVNDMASKFTRVNDKTDLGILFNKTISNSQKMFDDSANIFYKNVDDALAKEGVKDSKIIDLEPMRGELAKLLEQTPLRKMQAGTRGLIEDNLEYINSLAKVDKDAVTTYKASFEEANKLRSDILRLGRDLTAKDAATFKNAQRVAAQQITKALQQETIPESVKKAAETANAFYRKGTAEFNDQIIGGIMKKNPDDIFQMIVRGGDKPFTIRKTKEVLQRLQKLKGPDGKSILKEGEAENLQASLKGHFLSEMLRSGRTAESQYGSYLSANKMNTYLAKNKNVFEELFQGNAAKAGKSATGEIKQVEDVLNALSFAQGKLSREGGLPGGVAVQLLQAGAAGQILFMGEPRAESVGILLSPYIMGKLLLNKGFNKLLIDGITAPNISKARPVMDKLVNRMVAEGLIDRETANGYKEEVKKVESGESKGGIYVPKKNRAQSLDSTVPVAQGNFEEVAPTQATEQAPTPQQQIAPAPTRLPPMPAAPTSAAPATQDRGTQYQGLFPMDPTGQAIARRG